MEMGAFILFLALFAQVYAQPASVNLVPTGMVKLSSDYTDRLARFTAIDETNNVIYLTGEDKVHIFNMASGDSLTLLRDQSWPGNKLGQIRVCGDYVTIVMTDTLDPSVASLEVFELYDPGVDVDLVPIFSQQLPAGPGYHRMTSDCSKVIIPISAREDKTGMETIDGDGMIMILEFNSDFSSLIQSTNLTFEDFIGSQSSLAINGGLFYPNVGFLKGLEPVDACLSSDESMAYVVLSTNNLVATVDLSNGNITALTSLGYKDFSVGDGLDANSKDGINLANYDIRGAYTPSRIDCFEADGVEYFVTGNDGSPAYRNVEKLTNLNLDTTLFPNTRFQKKRFAGRLKVWNGGDVDSDGDIDAIYTIGTRSVSVWLASSVTLVADTGSMVEKKVADLKPDYYNADPNDGAKTISNTRDRRSIIRGPEPKGVVVFNTCKNRYLIAVVGLEMPGGLMVFSLDYKDPAAGFTFMNLAMPINATTTDTWNTAWANGEASMMGVQSLSLYSTRNPFVYAAGNIGSTLSGYRLDIECV